MRAGMSLLAPWAGSKSKMIWVSLEQISFSVQRGTFLTYSYF